MSHPEPTYLAWQMWPARDLGRSCAGVNALCPEQLAPETDTVGGEVQGQQSPIQPKEKLV